MTEYKQVLPVKPDPGNYDAGQKRKLAEIWDLIFQILNDPDKVKSGHFNLDNPHHGPPENASKEAKALHEEQRALKDLFTKHGVDEFYEQLWFLFGPDIPDMMILKFLRARKWNVHRAFAMLCNCLKWRIEMNVIDIIAKGDVGLGAEDKDFAHQGPTGKAYAVGMTDNLMPIIYIQVKRHIAKDQSAETMTKYVISCAESFRRIIRQPMEKIVIVFNLAGFGMKNMDWHSLLTIVSILEAYYPETLSKLYIYSAPWIFQGIWKALAPMLDPNVRSKIIFVNKPADLDLVPADRLETSMGGNLTDAMEWTPPRPGEKTALLRADPKRRQYWSQYMQQAKAYEEVTRRWVASDGQDEKLTEERHYMALKARATFLSLSSHFVASTMYDRAGIIRDDFCLEWTYKQKDGRIIKHIVGEETSLPALQKLISSREGKSNLSQDRTEGNQQGQGSGAIAGVAAGPGTKQSRSRKDSRRRSRTGSSREDKGASRGSRSDARQRRTSNGIEEPSRAQRSKANGVESGGSRSAGYGAAAGAGVATAAAGGAGMMSSGQNSNSRANLSYLSSTPKQRAGSSSASIFSYSSEDDVFVDADDFLGGQSFSPDAGQRPKGRRGQPARQAQDDYLDDEDQSEADDQEDDFEEGNGDEDVLAAGQTTTDQPRRRRGAPRPMVGENEKLAGFRDLAPEAHDQIAESNEKMREPFDPNQKRAKQSLWSRLNCCSGKNID